MLPVSAAELASIQADVVSAACDKVCQVWRKTTVTNDGYGTQTPSYTLTATTVAGMSEPSAGQLAAYASVIGDLVVLHVRLPVGTTVFHQDHLVIGGATLEVQVILEPRSYESVMSVIASEVV